MITKLLMSAAVIGAMAASSATPVAAQHSAGGIIVEYNDIDVALIAGGWSVVELLRGSVRNAGGDLVGYVHDAITLPNGATTFVIVNVAGFLDIGHKLVALPVAAFGISEKGDLILPNATKDNMKALPRFHYVRN